jgi:hypothetical protein
LSGFEGKKFPNLFGLGDWLLVDHVS